MIIDWGSGAVAQEPRYIGFGYVATWSGTAGVTVSITPPITDWTLDYDYQRTKTLDLDHTRSFTLDYDHSRGFVLDY